MGTCKVVVTGSAGRQTVVGWSSQTSTANSTEIGLCAVTPRCRLHPNLSSGSPTGTSPFCRDLHPHSLPLPCFGTLMLRRSVRADRIFVDMLSLGRAQGSSACAASLAQRVTKGVLVSVCGWGGTPHPSPADAAGAQFNAPARCKGVTECGEVLEAVKAQSQTSAAQQYLFWTARGGEFCTAPVCFLDSCPAHTNPPPSPTERSIPDPDPCMLEHRRRGGGGTGVLAG